MKMKTEEGKKKVKGSKTQRLKAQDSGFRMDVGT